MPIKISKIRKNWGPISPVTKIKPSKKIYSRKKSRKKRMTEDQIAIATEIFCFGKYR